MQNVITLTKTATGYNARYSGECRAEIVELFGADTIPTGFTTKADPVMVRDALAKNNPGYIVELAA